MKLNKRILRAINEGVSTALMLDDDKEPTIINRSSELISKNIKWNTEKALHSRLLQERLHDPMDIDEEFILNALSLYNKYGVLYNPYLDGENFKNFIKKCVDIQGDVGNLNWIDTSSVTNMIEIFEDSQFNGDISLWDVSHVTNMNGMFRKSFSESLFNGDISLWDVSSVTDMSYMFYGSLFNRDISLWNVSNVANMECMFEGSQFNGDISLWDVYRTTDMSYMFKDSQFNQDISGWDVSNVEDMVGMFYDSKFNQDISGWNVSKAFDTTNMFDNCQIPEENKPKFNI